MNQGVGAARRVGHAVSKRIRPSKTEVSAGAGVGEDDSEFGGNRSRAWFESLGEYVGKLLRLFEKSTFEKLGFETFLRRVLGLPPKVAPKLEVKKPPPKRLGAPTTLAPEEAQRLKDQIRQEMIQANARGAQNLRSKKSSTAETLLATMAPELPTITTEESSAPPIPSKLAEQETATSVPAEKPRTLIEETAPLVKAVREGPWAFQSTETHVPAAESSGLTVETISPAAPPKLQVRSVRAESSMSDLVPLEQGWSDRPTDPPPAPPRDLAPRIMGTESMRIPAPPPRSASFRKPPKFDSVAPNAPASGEFFEETDPEVAAYSDSEKD